MNLIDLYYNKYLYDCFAHYRNSYNIKLTIREEKPGGGDIVYTAEKRLEGTKIIFNLDKEKSKLCIGSCPDQFKMQEQIPLSPFEGDIEDLVIGDIPIGLWNFDEAYDNNHGAIER